jgi:hypothetical protein
MATWQRQVEKGFKCMEELSYSFGQNWKPNHILLYLRLKRQYKSKVKLNDYWTNLHKN